MNKVVLSIGSNSADCKLRMQECAIWLKSVLQDAEMSHIYETPAINGIDENYLNSVCQGTTEMSFEDVYSMMKDYEVRNGRTSESKLSGSIPIDIDIVIWNDEILREKDYNRSYFQIGWNELNNK